MRPRRITHGHTPTTEDKHLAANKKVGFAFQQKSSTMPMMNPSPSEIVDLLSFVEATLMQYATVAGPFPGVTASSLKPKPKKANKAEVTVEESLKERFGLMPQHLSQRLKDKDEAHLRQARLKLSLNLLKPRQEAKVEAKEGVESQRQNQKRESSNAFHSLGDHGKRVIIASVNTSLTMTDDQSRSALRFSRSMMKLSKDSMRIGLRQKKKAAPRGGVGLTAPMIILDPEENEEGVVPHAVRAPDSDEHYAMVDSGTNAIIAPLHPAMRVRLQSVKFRALRLHDP